MHLSINNQDSIKSINNLLKELFPIHRTLVNEGFYKSLKIIQNKIPIKILEYPSGEKVYDWIIPDSWNVKKAFIKTIDGKTLVDFTNNNLHLSAYSSPFKGKISHEELSKHINFREDLPHAIPYNFLYYKNGWSFNISYNQFKKDFIYEEYYVEIETEKYPDFLRIGELFLEGQLKDEILITTYLCHPSMVNDNLSGTVTSVELFNYLKEIKTRRYSYRLLILPETIGSITYIAKNEHKLNNVIAGFTLYCCGGSGKFHFKKSYFGNTYIDKVLLYTLEKYYESDYEILDFWPGGSDERQFNGPGIRLPFGAITKSPPAEFKEYHTSLDNLDLIQVEELLDTLNKIVNVINVIECDILYKNKYKGEPCFSRHNINYPKFDDALVKSSAYNVKILANEIDGKLSLLDISKKWNIDIFNLYDLAKEFERENLIKEVR